MANFNKVFLLGRLTRDPELRYTKSGIPVAEFTIAVNREYTDSKNKRVSKACFVDVLAWRRTAELVSQYLGKGSELFVEGRLEYETWESNDGHHRSKIRVVAESIQFLGGRKTSTMEEKAGPLPGPEDEEFEL
ncbi:single-stranded DNA-binding protein [Planctomycetota bacterium]